MSAQKKAMQFVTEIDQAELATRLIEVGCHMKRPTGMTGAEAWQTFVQEAANGSIPAYIVEDFNEMAKTAIEYFGERIAEMQKTN